MAANKRDIKDLLKLRLAISFIRKTSYTKTLEIKIKTYIEKKLSPTTSDAPQFVKGGEPGVLT